MRLLLLALAALGFASRLNAADRKPNVVVIVGDDMGYADVGVHGCKDIPTPHLDALANSGVRCSSGYVSGPYCSPTRAGLLTGRYQTRFGHEFNPGGNAKGEAAKIGLSLKETTFPDRMKAAGYATGMVGKWHLGAVPELHPMQRGFGSYYGFLGGAHPYFPTKGQAPILRGTEPVDEKEYLTDAFAREAVAFIEANRAKPFFLYLAFNAVHTPMQATEKYKSRFPNIKDSKRQTYAGMMSAMDDAVGAVRAKLADAKLTNDTLVFFVSDNGGPPVNGSNNGPLHGHKATTWEGGVRVPWFASWPGTLPAGQVYDRPVIQLDILPTALAAAGVNPPSDAKFDGVNLLPHLTGKQSGDPHPALFWRFGQQTAVRKGDWKLTEANGSNGKKLFNLAEDIGENKDRSAELPDKVKELQAAWDEWNKGNVPAAWGPARQMRKKN